MERQTIRSWRDPAFWLPLACALPLIVALGLAAHGWVPRYIHDLESLRDTQPEVAAAAAERALRLLGRGICGFSLATALLLSRYFQLALREERLPPSGWWSLGARRIVVGSGARSLARFGLGLALSLALAGVGCLLAVRHLLEIL